MRDFHGWPQSLQENTKTVPQPGRNRFISDPFQSPITNHPITGRNTVSTPSLKKPKWKNQAKRAGCRSANNLDSYSGSSWFESRSRHRLFWCVIFVVVLSPYRKISIGVLRALEEAKRFALRHSWIILPLEALVIWCTGSVVKQPKFWSASRSSELFFCYADLHFIVPLR
jgi:hypothetical protein